MIGRRVIWWWFCGLKCVVLRFVWFICCWLFSIFNWVMCCKRWLLFGFWWYRIIRFDMLFVRYWWCLNRCFCCKVGGMWVKLLMLSSMLVFLVIVWGIMGVCVFICKWFVIFWRLIVMIVSKFCVFLVGLLVWVVM